MVVRGRSTEGGKDQKGTTRSNSKDSNGKEKCWFCGKSGHLKKDCQKRQQASKEDSTIEANSNIGMVDEFLYVFCVSPPVFAYYGIKNKKNCIYFGVLEIIDCM